MFCRTLAAAAIVLCTTLPALGVELKPVDEALAGAAHRMQAKDYRGTREAALNVTDRGSRAFLSGIAASRLELWEEAAAELAIAAESYPILADYALYYQGQALSRLTRHDQALPPLYKILKQYPDSRLVRATLILYADTLFAAGHASEALQSYSGFVERYPAGSDSISALFGSALCREKLGDPAAAAGMLRNLYLSYPASPFADKAAGELQRLSAAGIKVEPYTTAELFKRAGTLYNLGRHLRAAEAYAEIPVSAESGEFIEKLKLKKGQALYKARRYQQAKATFSNISGAGHEPGLWFARTLDKTGDQEEAFKLYMNLAQDPKGGSVAKEALLEAAYIKRFQRKWSEAVTLFKSYLAAVPGQKTPNVLWEAAWSSYQSRDYQDAASQLSKLSLRDDLREKALYWLGKALSATGDAKGSQEAFAALAAEYPLGYYALISNSHAGEELPLPPGSIIEALPLPAGFEREKALIGLGLFDEAGRELYTSRKNKNPAGIARLYLEMGNYNGAYHTMAREKPKRDKESAIIWGVTYPLAYREDVAKNAAANALPESLVWAIMRTESNYLPVAKSPVGALGLMQIMPATAESMSKGGSKRLTHPDLNIKLGTLHLKDLLQSYDRNLTLAIAAYNAGSGNVKRWQKGYGHLPEDEFIESIPFRETREYVKKVVSSMEMYQRLYRLPPYKHPEPKKQASPDAAEPAGAQKLAQIAPPQQ